MELNLKVLYQSLPFAVLVFLMRLVCIFLGTVTGGFLTKAARNEKYFICHTSLPHSDHHTNTTTAQHHLTHIPPPPPSTVPPCPPQGRRCWLRRV